MLTDEMRETLHAHLRRLVQLRGSLLELAEGSQERVQFQMAASILELELTKLGMAFDVELTNTPPPTGLRVVR